MSPAICHASSINQYIKLFKFIGTLSLLNVSRSISVQPPDLGRLYSQISYGTTSRLTLQGESEETAYTTVLQAIFEQFYITLKKA